MNDDVTAILAKKPGEYVVYHRGNLAADRGTGLKREHITAEHRAIDENGSIAWKLYLLGKVTLVQRRVAPGVVDYLAIRLTTP